jgi:cytosine/adenosine deaminase-related metal-dependent hydrolase
MTKRRTVALARRWSLSTHLHVAETQDEIDMLRTRTAVQGQSGLRHVE